MTAPRQTGHWTPPRGRLPGFSVAPPEPPPPIVFSCVELVTGGRRTIASGTASHGVPVVAIVFAGRRRTRTIIYPRDTALVSRAVRAWRLSEVGVWGSLRGSGEVSIEVSTQWQRLGPRQPEELFLVFQIVRRVHGRLGRGMWIGGEECEALDSALAWLETARRT